MGVPNKRLKKLMMTTGIALGVYAGLKYLLPLAIPFFVALGLAEVLRPWAEWLQEKLSFSVKGHRVKISLGILGGFLLLGLIFLASLLCYFGGKKLFQEGKLLLYNLPGLARKADILLTEWCGRMEEVLHLEGGCILKWARELSRNLASQAAARAMPYVMGNSVDWLKAAVKAAVVFVVVVFGTILAIQEGEQIHGYFKHSVFCREYVQMGRILKVIGAAYGKTKLLILAGTTVICIGGLFLIGNPYYGILGVLIGLLDALPFIGTGTILFPWAAVAFMKGDGGRGTLLLGIYLASYFLRQVMESKVMGEKAGLSPFLTLAAVYVGIQLFGILGVILGPLGFLIVRESVDA